MPKNIVKALCFFIICLVLSGAMAFSATQKLTLFVLTKEKTVMANNKEVTGLLDFKYFIKKNATIVTQEAGVYLSYQGNLITGVIKVKSASAVLDAAQRSGEALRIDYLHSKNKVITKYSFTSCVMKGAEAKKKGGKVTEVIYTFQAKGMTETRE